LAVAGTIRHSFMAAAALMAVLLLGVNAEIIPKVEPFLSARAAARATPLDALGSPNLAILGISRSWEYGLDFYLNRALPQWTPATPAPSWIWTTEEGASELRSRTKASVIARVSAQAWLVRIDN
jgi:hypothetical protein